MKPLDPSARASRPELDVHLTENVMVATRDGVRLATDIYRPAPHAPPAHPPPPPALRRPPPQPVAQRAARPARRPVPLLRRPGLRGGEPGLPRLLRLRGRGELPHP